MKDIKLAVLIDGDNIPSKYIKEMMEEIAKYGTPTIKRIYGDWTKPHLSKWKKVLLETAINPIQQYGYTTGKNATDSAMIIDAMDVLYTGNVDGFCLVSSDLGLPFCCSDILARVSSVCLLPALALAIFCFVSSECLVPYLGWFVPLFILDNNSKVSSVCFRPVCA